MNQWLGLTMVSAAAMLAACGGGSDLGGGTETDLGGARGSLMHNPPLRGTELGKPMNPPLTFVQRSLPLWALISQKSTALDRIWP